jgi:flagellar biosynthesis protein FlhF
MQVRVFEAADMATGLRMVKKELGPDALILSTRTIKSGKFGLLGKPMLEITAAIDADYQPETTSANNNSKVWSYSESEPAHQKSSPLSVSRSAINHVIDDSVEEYLHAELKKHPQTPEPKPSPTREEPQANAELQSEVNELKDLVKSLAGQIAQLSERRDTAPVRTPAIQVREPSNQARIASPVLQGDHILSNLIDKGINVETSRTIAGFLRESLTEQELSDEDLVNATIIDIIT